MGTSHITLTQTPQEIGTGPLSVDVAKGTALIHFADSAPQADTLARHQRTAGTRKDWLAYEGSEKAWAWRGQFECEIVVTATS